jgi:DNA polymerase-3 subunit alpha
MGIPILPPDVNRSALKFIPELHGETSAIRYGLAAIKNVGEGAMEIAIAERQANGDFVSLEDFSRRLDSRVANRKILENLIKCGAFDFLKRERAELFACIDESMAAAVASQRDRASGQVSLFDDMPPPAPRTGSRHVIPWTEHEKMSYEKELLGFYVTGHPLDAYAAVLASGNYQTISSLNELADRSPFKIAGAIVQVDKKFTKKEGKPFAVIQLEDLTATLEVVLWNEVYTTVAEALVLGRVIGVHGTLDRRDDALRAVAQRARALTATAKGPAPGVSNGNGNGNGNGLAAKPAPLVLSFSPAVTPEELRQVKAFLASSPGNLPVRLMFSRADGGFVQMDADIQVQLTPDLRARLAPWLQPNN